MTLCLQRRISGSTLQVSRGVAKDQHTKDPHIVSIGLLTERSLRPVRLGHIVCRSSGLPGRCPQVNHQHQKQPPKITLVFMTSSSRTSSVLAFRASELAQIPTSIVRDDLKVTFLALSFGTSCLSTESDKNQPQSSYLLGRKALWTKELEVALKEDATDMLVHDLNGVAQIPSDGCEIGAMLWRVLLIVW